MSGGVRLCGRGDTMEIHPEVILIADERLVPLFMRGGDLE